MDSIESLYCQQIQFETVRKRDIKYLIECILELDSGTPIYVKVFFRFQNKLLLFIALM